MMKGLRCRLVDAMPTAGRIHFDPMADTIRHSIHVSANRVENRRFQQAVSRIDNAVKKYGNRERWSDIIDLAKKSEKPGTFLVMIANISRCNAKKAEEFLNLIRQIARRKELNAILSFDKKVERTETDVQRVIRQGVNAALESANPHDIASSLGQRFGEDILEILKNNQLMIVNKKTKGRTVTACVSVEKVITLPNGGIAYVIYNMPDALAHIAGWINRDGKDIYVIDRALGERNGEAKLTMRSRVSGTLQHELQHLLNHYFYLSRVDNEYSAYLAGFAFGRIQNKHITRIQKPDRKYHAAAQHAISRIASELDRLDIKRTKDAGRKEIAKTCVKLLDMFYLEKTGLSYTELVTPFRDHAHKS